MFATAIHLHPSLIFAGKAGTYQSGAPYGTPLFARYYYTRVEVNGSGKRSTYYDTATITAIISFMVQAPVWQHRALLTS